MSWNFPKDRTPDAKDTEAYFQALWDLQLELGIQDGHCKTYDPLTIEGDEKSGIAHSYVFDLHDGGRHHSIPSFAELRKSALLETVECIKRYLEEKEPTPPQEQWMEERRKIEEIVPHDAKCRASVFFMRSCDCGRHERVDRLLTLLTTQIDLAEKRGIAKGMHRMAAEILNEYRGDKSRTVDSVLFDLMMRLGMTNTPANKGEEYPLTNHN